MININLKKLNDFLKNAKIGIFTFTKESKNFLYLLKESNQKNINVKYLFDFTLPYRKEGFELAKTLINEEKIITEHNQILKKLKECDFVLFFNTGIDDNIIQQNNKNKYDLSTFLKKQKELKRILSDYGKEKSEWLFHLSVPQSMYLEYFNFLQKNNIIFNISDITNLYNLGGRSFILDEEIETEFLKIKNNLNADFYFFEKMKEIEIVIGEDWGCGKTNYVINENIKNIDQVLCNDFWFTFFSDSYTNVKFINNMPNSILLSDIYKQYKRKIKKSVFKSNGRIEEFSIGMPFDRTNVIKGFWKLSPKKFFLTIVVKPNTDKEKVVKHIEIIKEREEIPDEQINIVQFIGYDIKDYNKTSYIKWKE